MSDFQADIDQVSQVPVVRTILDVVTRTTGMRFAAVARVTPERWVACSVLDQIDFGLKPGGELKVETTICHEIRASGEAVVINDVTMDPTWCGHHTPAMYGFRSYISVPIMLEDGSFFGTLCAIDPLPAKLQTPEVIGMFTLFAELIARHLDARGRLAQTQLTLTEERSVSELREQFIAVLGHDLRNPLGAITTGLEILRRSPANEHSAAVITMMKNSAARMAALIDDVLDFARGRLGGGIAVMPKADEPLEPALRKVIGELQVASPESVVWATFALDAPVNCDPARIAQLLSNLLGNAITYGAAGKPIRVNAATDDAGLEISVANTGEPIGADALPHLFQPFYRGAVRPSRQGLGLGLFIAHQIALAHGGTLEVVSTDEETRFTFRMPRV